MGTPATAAPDLELHSTATSLDHAMSSFLDAISSGADKMGNVITKAWDYAEVQLTEVVRQFLLWEFTSAVLTALSFLVVMFVVHAVYRACKQSWHFEYESENRLRDQSLVNNNPSWVVLATSAPHRFIITVAYLLCMFYSSDQVLTGTKIAAKIAIAPRIYLIEYGIDKYKTLKQP